MPSLFTGGFQKNLLGCRYVELLFMYYLIRLIPWLYCPNCDWVLQALRFCKMDLVWNKQTKRLCNYFTGENNNSILIFGNWEQLYQFKIQINKHDLRGIHMVSYAWEQY